MVQHESMPTTNRDLNHRNSAPAEAQFDFNDDPDQHSHRSPITIMRDYSFCNESVNVN